MRPLQPAAPAVQQPDDRGQVGGLVAGDARQCAHPAGRTVRFGPAIEQLKRIGGCLLLEISVIIEKCRHVLDHTGCPRVGGSRKQRQVHRTAEMAHAITALSILKEYRIPGDFRQPDKRPDSP